MRNTAIAVLALLVVVSGFAPAVAATGATGAQDTVECEYPLTLTDATGEEVTVDEEPESIVALQPSDAQTAFEIGAEDKVVGMPVSQYTDYLEVGDQEDITEDDGATPVAEKVIDLEPDVVLAANTAIYQEGLIEQLRDAGLTVYVFESASSIEHVQEQTLTAGQLAGECEGAQETVDWMDQRLEIIDTALEDQERPLALYAMGGGYTAGNNTFQHELLTTAGVENLGAEVGIEGWQEISAETVVDEDPEWIIYPDWAEEPPVDEAVQSTTAYENENFVAVNDNYMSQPAPRIVYAIEEITQAVHPEAYEEAEAELEASDETEESDETETETETEASGEDTETDEATETDDEEADEATETDDEGMNGESGDDDSAGDAEEDTIPGFGVPAAVAAVLAAVGLLSRRR